MKPVPEPEVRPGTPAEVQPIGFGPRDRRAGRRRGARVDALVPAWVDMVMATLNLPGPA
jgi:hypothetical protein